MFAFEPCVVFATVMVFKTTLRKPLYEAQLETIRSGDRP